MVSTAAELDRELIELYEFSVDVSDEGVPPRRSAAVVKVTQPPRQTGRPAETRCGPYRAAAHPREPRSAGSRSVGRSGRAAADPGALGVQTFRCITGATLITDVCGALIVHRNPQRCLISWINISIRRRINVGM